MTFEYSKAVLGIALHRSGDEYAKNSLQMEKDINMDELINLSNMKNI